MVLFFNVFAEAASPPPAECLQGLWCDSCVGEHFEKANTCCARRGAGVLVSLRPALYDGFGVVESVRLQ